MIHALWAAPRTVSTAFERMMIERGDHLVLDEPWSRAYYFGPDRRSERYPLVFPESSYPAVTAAVLELGSAEPVFVKDMAYQALPGMTDVALAAMSHTFLVRDPAAALPSLHREWPDFTDDEAGYAAQRRLFDRVLAVTGQPPAVIDSDVLRADPDGVVQQWCGRVGLEHRPETLTWRPGMRPEWQLWQSWYANAAASTGFLPPVGGSAPDIAPRVATLLASATDDYHQMAVHAIRP